MKKFIINQSNQRNIIGLFFITVIVYIAMLWITIPRLKDISGGLGILDMQSMGYSTEYVRMLLVKLGDIGRTAYLTQQIPLEMVFPLVFAISCSMLLAYILSKSYSMEQRVFNWLFLPILAGLFDYFENCGSIILIKSFPDISPTMVKISSFFTVLKGLCTTCYFCVLIWAVIAYIKNKRQRVRDDLSS